MDTTEHSLATLFAQLGLPSDAESIDAFIDSHRPLPDAVRVADAPFWNAAQSAFLREAIVDDADWAELVGVLDARLR